MTDRLILGCGYFGRRLARAWAKYGRSVGALTRSAERATEFEACGLQAVCGDLLDAQSLRALPDSQLVVSAVGFDRDSGATREDVYLTGLKNTLAAIEGRCGCFIYVSSTSVYGQSAGEWIDESSPTEPAREIGQLLLQAESLVHDFGVRNGIPTHILRFAGIYGPDRLLAKATAIAQGVPLHGRPDSWLNLIHVDDAVSAALSVEELPGNETWLVSDDEPVRRADYYGLVAELCGAQPPAFDEHRSAPRGHSQGINKRCRNDALKEKTNWSPRFPTFREGLRSILRNP